MLSKYRILCQFYTLVSQNLINIEIHPYGSYIFQPEEDSDIDCIILTDIKEEDFYEKLKGISEDIKDIKDVKYIKNANVPIVKCQYSGIDFDMIIVNSVKYEEIFDMKIILQGDMEIIKKLSGIRGTYKILSLIEKKDKFKSLLKEIKEWAKTNQIYGQTYGYLGGISWTILVAKICQLYPNDITKEKFFAYYSQYDWTMPITLCEPEDNRRYIYSWQYNQTKKNFMKILIPIFPIINTAQHLTSSTNTLTIHFLKKMNYSILSPLVSYDLILHEDILIPLRWLISKLENQPVIKFAFPRLYPQSIHINLILNKNFSSSTDLTPILTEFQEKYHISTTFTLTKLNK